MDLVRAVIKLEVPEYQIGQPVTIYFKDTMQKFGICDKEQESVEPIKPLDKDDDYTFMCSNCKGELFCGDILRDNFCPTCGRSVKWE